MLPSRPRTWLSAVSLAVWLGTLFLGFWVFQNYNNAAGEVGDTPTRDAPQPDAALRQPCLLLFLHPHCPCSRASLKGLAEILTNPTILPVKAQVLFVLPPGASVDWERSPLWETAVAIPKVYALLDKDGARAKNLGIKSSGHAVLFDVNGALRYSGGLTASRGHNGDSAGRDALLRLMTGKTSNIMRAPVFGCALFDDE